MPCKAAVRSVDFCRVRMYWAIGQRIAEKEQQGKERAGYGTYLIKNLAKQLQPEYGSGFSVRQLEMCRQFYRIYPIANTLCSQLNWSQYKLLISIPDPDKRESKVHAADGVAARSIYDSLDPADKFVQRRFQLSSSRSHLFAKTTISQI